MTAKEKEKLLKVKKEAKKMADEAVWKKTERLLKVPVTIVAVLMLLFLLILPIYNQSQTAIDPPKAYEAVSEDYYVTFKMDGEQVCGESTILAQDDESWIIQMGDKVYVVSKKSVMFE